MPKLAKFLPILGQMRRLMQNGSGATAIEYAMIASGIAMAIAAAITLLGGTTTGLYDAVLNIFP